MREEERKPNLICIFPDLLEDILLLLPLRSIFKFKTVSKQWRSILESKMFVERRMSLNKDRRRILAAYNCNCRRRPSLLPESQFEGDQEIMYLHCDSARPSLTCDGLFCFPEPDWINVLNPSTRELRRFYCGPDPLPSVSNRIPQLRAPWYTLFPGDWIMGFGIDNVTGSCKVVRMRFDPVEECEVLDVETGEWQRKLRPPPYKVDIGRKSVCVNGSIYWLKLWRGVKILALNLHTLEFRNVPFPDTWVTEYSQIHNLDDRLAMSTTTTGPDWRLKILSLDVYEETWSKTYSISLASLTFNPRETTWFTPLTVSKSGDVVFYDNHKRLFKYYQEKDEFCCLASDICVITDFLENLAPLQAGRHRPIVIYPDHDIRKSRCRLFSKQPEMPGSEVVKFWVRVLDVVFTTLIVGKVLELARRKIGD